MKLSRSRRLGCRAAVVESQLLLLLLQRAQAVPRRRRLPALGCLAARHPQALEPLEPLTLSLLPLPPLLLVRHVHEHARPSRRPCPRPLRFVLAEHAEGDGWERLL